MEKKDTKEELNFERIFSQIDNACSALLCLKKELFDYWWKENGCDISKSRSKNIEGEFDGKCLMTGDRRYPVPENYLSKSKLVVGDKLKLTIEKDGHFNYKQIGPVERKKMVGKLQEINKQYFAQVKKRLYEIPRAAVTYLKAKPGDYVTIMAPEGKLSRFAALVNIIK
ncbi:hypothetical protein CO101_02965 [Candidatus Berkelbacteria bacterium CG_4_9_14_3_um_filter_39_23]|uniref:Uncharacterized protein n=2 Tax=Candidatus Berkelbacteria TaxID=1618330 RepID=A0A2M7CJ47_9BACT|nr:hypothetical protein [Candidatus Berkelbacteria bacterium]OIP05832.1 MAG: hypothetical protein AUK14_01030 [Candidatus Berkelbacteria bacterium CG2_30_39_44]PIV25681.1 MAG: hypothetical protein COS38_00300 [Candidatus Berkelbacteria bacterium CG03_land_8_20_14_0_80_40_36]PIX30808.1 MAG: hypothetical protein COZ62_00665 [Candidatus Berkelbacteria bacterium CG_4_8_14_3_um_filter_39_27]PJB51080.1 MAG: hypothetical protein CO101_02965 [Candidatus Berkelbacteria bacterium CG_4_9_14_3_um_filter_39